MTTGTGSSPAAAGALGETPSRCPRCSGAFELLHTPQGVRLDRCAACKGLWLDKGEINFFTAEWEYMRDYPLERAQPTEMPCPSCGARLQEGLWTSADLKVDKCPTCGGIFFEAGELATVGRLHAGIEHSLSADREIDWFGFARPYILVGALLTSGIAALWALAGLLFGAGTSAAALALLGVALLAVVACRFTGNELGDASCRALRGLDLPMSFVPQHVALTGTLRCGEDEIRLIDPTGTVAVWTRIPVPPFPQLDALWLPRVRALPPETRVRAVGLYRAWPLHRFQVTSIFPLDRTAGTEIRSITSRATLWGAAASGAILLLLAILLTTSRTEPALAFSLAREHVALEAESWLRLGVNAAYEGKYGAARQHLAQAVACDRPGTEDDRVVAEAWYDMGVVLLIEQKRVEARKAFEDALAKDPRCSWAREALELLTAGKPFGVPGVDWRVFEGK